LNTSPDTPQPQPIEPVEPQSAAATSAVVSVASAESAPPRDPVWNGWDVLALVFVAIVLFFGLLFLVTAFFSGATFQQKLNRFAAVPELALGVQALVELLLIGCMYLIVAARTGGARFWKSVHWNWPANMGTYLFVGALMQTVFIFVERFLPFPKETPFDAVLRRPYSIVAIAIFSVTLGPLFEELFFRGFLYGVLRRPFGVFTAIVGTALPFGLVHAAQYGYSWASVMLIFAVGVVLATVREKKQSLAASFLVHVAYNSVIVLILLIATGGFRHLEKLR
jgi:membrane protease YdiL (CAAX protease family)